MPHDTMFLQRQDISEAMKSALTRIRELILAEKVSTEEKRQGGWKYGGKELEFEMRLLNDAMDSKYKVLDSNVFHFVNGAIIHNPTKSLVMIPLNGTPKLNSGEPLLLDTSYYTEERQLLFGEQWDIILAAMEKDTP
ncbi:uncharacterized protein BP01DRAFT_17764 [Aspergillus saccharolyticus JOP 1030-1]|uniref:Uncharacterized protein n=1 Tax=Aspergillus saccharolyticus JOP 1030-1 TaxID=1450539 RepID=A0A318ZGB5_9EURO|nr:hypothetical protein BP01DRAFT_17764 [Aspergillus saccharolyticus JOP 1030-1]PYH46591.1 hypothetical protein BP01DRAFT_17764 [Aspergillus saccharolyticus JOP 1030-1]